MRPRLRCLGSGSPDVGCETSVPGRHRAAPRVALGASCQLPLLGSRGCRPSLTHRHTNPVQARSLRHAFLPCLCPPHHARFLPASPCPARPSFGALSPRFHGLHRRRFQVDIRAHLGQWAGKACPTLRCRPEVSPLFPRSFLAAGSHNSGISKRTSPQFPVSPAPSWSPGQAGRQRPSQSPLQGHGSSVGIFFNRLFF